MNSSLHCSSYQIYYLLSLGLTPRIIWCSWQPDKSTLVMHRAYSSTTSSSSTLLRAARVGISSSISRTSVPLCLSRTSLSHSSPSSISYLSLSLSRPSSRSLRWSNGVDWRSPLSLRAQIRRDTSVIERFQRKIATMGIIWFSGLQLLNRFAFLPNLFYLLLYRLPTLC